MKLINKKIIQVLSDGSLFFNYSNILKTTQVMFFKRDNNKSFNSKKTKPTLESKDFRNYKKKHLN